MIGFQMPFQGHVSIFLHFHWPSLPVGACVSVRIYSSGEQLSYNIDMLYDGLSAQKQLLAEKVSEEECSS